MIQHRLIRAAALFLCLYLGFASIAHAEDVSNPVILQFFDSTYGNVEHRMPDIFGAGYGAMWTPPPGRAWGSNESVGYNPYDRFDLGSISEKTLYGTEKGLKSMVQSIHQIGGNSYIDLIWNHNGNVSPTTTDGQGHNFRDAGGFPGFNLDLPSDQYGDFHQPGLTSDTETYLLGLRDIAQEKSGAAYSMIRSPVDASDPRNIKPGTTPAFGRLANVANPNNARFYPDTSLTPLIVDDPASGQTGIKIYPFNKNNPMAGDAVPETAMQYLMRNVQWMVQTIGVDGFRIDAAKHMPTFVLENLDLATYHTTNRKLLNGDVAPAFNFMEIYDGDPNKHEQYIRKDIDPTKPNQVGGNRDSLDFPLMFALRSNLTRTNGNNNWNNVAHASLDYHDDGLINGSQGVAFVQSHDDFGPPIDNVAYAYMLMKPGDAVVYFNAKEFGNNRAFPKTGRGDALGGVYGDRLTTLVDLRNRYGRGNYHERLLETRDFAYEREGSCIVLLNNSNSSGFDSRTIQTDFAPGTHLVELTGNATSTQTDPNNSIADTLVVKGDGSVDVRFLRNSVNGTFVGRGYLIYGLPTPQGTMSFTNVAQTLAGETATANNNGTARLADISVIKSNSFTVNLKTTPVVLSDGFHDVNADGDNAILRIDGGLDLNGNGKVDSVNPTSTAYGFDQFTTKNSPLFDGGDGEFAQTIDTSKLSEGYHYVTARAYRHNDGNSSTLFTDWRETIYVDRLKPISAPRSADPINGNNANRRVEVRSLDKTADTIHALADIGAALTDTQVLALLSNSNLMAQVDRDIFSKDFTGITSGTHALTLVTQEITGTYNIQRYFGLSVTTSIGAGLGDTNFDSLYSPTDINLFGDVLDSGNMQFNPAADLDADGLVTLSDLQLLGDRLAAVNAGAATLQAYDDLVSSHNSLVAMETRSIGGRFIMDEETHMPEPSSGILITLMSLIITRRRIRQ